MALVTESSLVKGKRERVKQWTQNICIHLDENQTWKKPLGMLSEFPEKDAKFGWMEND